jgi:integrase
LHKVRLRLAGGRCAEYWYAWRGGPRILQVVAASTAERDRLVRERSGPAVAAYQAEAGGRADGRFLAGLVAKFLDEVEANTALAERTKADLRKNLDPARTELGDMPVKALEGRRARSVLMAWRDQWVATPKTADARLGALAQVLEWAAGRGDIPANPLKDWPRLYSVNRADVIWEPQHLAVLLPRITTDAGRDAVLFAAHAGPRVSDNARIPLSAVREHAIVWQTGKSRGRRTIVIPLTDELRPVVDRLTARARAAGALTLLVNSYGKPWTTSGLQTTVQKAKQKALAAARKAGGPQAASGIEHLRVHDLRGTAATNLVRAGLLLDEVAFILGWEKRKVEAIAQRYVTGEAIALAIVERMRRNKAAGGGG